MTAKETERLIIVEQKLDNNSDKMESMSNDITEIKDMIYAERKEREVDRKTYVTYQVFGIVGVVFASAIATIVAIMRIT